MYYARGMRDLLQTTQLSIEFFRDLDDFQINFIEMCFKQSLDEKMGLMTEVEKYNFHIFEEFKLQQIEERYGLHPELLKKSA
ncbi:MAG: hypothetical protein CME62_09240 [Halobacteriovoraceae bacterium]|nr:hypothetical protein [Halobacteriovoraceae bacterium]|tara:strand:+ start:7832 stop:8077 length:246 start_codon:yes stop_codon:yes gene_type:complete